MCGTLHYPSTLGLSSVGRHWTSFYHTLLFQRYTWGELTVMSHYDRYKEVECSMAEQVLAALSQLVNQEYTLETVRINIDCSDISEKKREQRYREVGWGISDLRG